MGTPAVSASYRYIETGNGCWEREKWFHLSASVEGSVMKLFKNGVAIASASNGFEPRDMVRNRVYLGRSHNHGADQLFKGSMTDVFIFGGKESSDASSLATAPDPTFLLEGGSSVMRVRGNNVA